MIGLVLSCEHASWTLPPTIDLGVSGEILRSQASWDPGAYEIAAAVGLELGLPIHTGAFSRMWVDLNRPPEHVDVIPRQSYGAPVPGNATLTAAEHAARLADYHAPYWRAVGHDVRARLRSIGTCLHLSFHSFDPALDPERRAFDLGVLYDPARDLEADLAERLQFGLRAAGFAVRANQPYRGTDPALVTSLRGQLVGERYAGIELEASFAVTLAAGGCARVAAAVGPLLDELRAGA